jgi:hypothetical protein
MMNNKTRAFAMALSLVSAMTSSPTFSADALGYASKPEAANKADRNDRKSAEALVSELAKAGVFIVSENSKDKELAALASAFCNETPGANGLFAPLSTKANTSIMAICTSRVKTEAVVQNTLLHETGHAIQWCKSGKPNTLSDVKPLDWKTKEMTRTALAFASLGALEGAYHADHFQMEAEAQTFAETTSLLGASKAVAKACK